MSEVRRENQLKRIVNHPVFMPYLVLAILFIISSIASPTIFPTQKNIMNVLRQGSIVGVASIGMTLVLLVGGIDLSVPAVMSLTACLLSDMMKNGMANGQNGIMLGPVLLVLLLGCVIGAINGLIVVSRNLEPFIVTLGINQVVNGIIMVYRKGAPGGKVTDFWKAFGSQYFLGVPWRVLFYLFMMVVFMLLLNCTTYGRHIYAIGSNAEAARLTGVRVNRDKVLAYVLCGLTAALAGVMLMARVRVGEPSGGKGYEMDALAAAVIGGTAMSGGVGNLIGTLAGVLVMAIMNNILNLVGADPNLQGVIKGCIILAAVLTQRKNK